MMAEAKDNWAQMSPEKRAQYLPRELSEEEKAERDRKREAKKQKKEEEKKKNEESKSRGRGKKKKEDSDDDAEEESKTHSPSPKRGRKPTKKSKVESESASPSKSKSKSKSPSKPKKGVTNRIAEYAKKIAKHKDTPAFDVPIKMYNPDASKASSTTVNKMLKKSKVVLISNVAIADPNAKEHFEGF